MQERTIHFSHSYVGNDDSACNGKWICWQDYIHQRYAGKMLVEKKLSVSITRLCCIPNTKHILNSQIPAFETRLETCGVWCFSETTSRIWGWRGWKGPPAVLTSTPLNTSGISLGMLFMPVWPTEPCWLTTNAGWKMGCHGVRPGWWSAWGGGARLLWLCVVLPHTTEAPVCLINQLLNCQYVLFLQASIIQSTKQHQTRVNRRVSCLAEKILKFFHGCNP